MLSALLVQLFGREPIDRLAAAGFDTAESITAAGPERLAEESGIPVALARRIIAVAAEERGGPDPATTAGEAAAEEKPAGEEKPADERHVRRPFRRPHSDLASRERGTRKRTRKSEKPAEEDPPPPGGKPVDGDPFVDDVGLVAWMGFAANRGAGPGGGWSVSDAILRSPAPEPAAAPEDAPAAAPEPAAPEPAAPEVASRAAAAPLGAVTPGAPVVEGSFWAFGGWKPSPPDRAPRPADRPEAPGDQPPPADLPAPAGSPILPDGSTAPGAPGQRGAAATPRRRSRDGH